MYLDTWNSGDLVTYRGLENCSDIRCPRLWISRLISGVKRGLPEIDFYDGVTVSLAAEGGTCSAT